MTERKRKNIENIENAVSALNEVRMHSPQLENIVLTLIWAGGQAGHCGNCGRTEQDEQVKEAEQAKDAEGAERTEISGAAEVPESEVPATEKPESSETINEADSTESPAPGIGPETEESTGPDIEPDAADSESDIAPDNTIEMEEFRRRRSKRSQYWSHNRTYWLRGAEAKLEKVFPMCSIASRQEFICKLQLVPGLLEYCCAAIYDHFGSEPFSMIRAAEETQQGETPIAAGSSDDASAAGREEAAR